jgi:hypothetical protein
MSCRLLPGDKQNLIKSYVGKYREMANLQMTGLYRNPETKVLEQDENIVAEFPDLAAAMIRNSDISRTYGK